MKKVLLVLCFSVLMVGVGYAGTQVYVKSNASLKKKPTASAAFKITEQMKTDVLKLGEITESTVKGVKGIDNRKEAKQVIEEMLKDGDIKTIEDRYADLFPSLDVSP